MNIILSALLALCSLGIVVASPSQAIAECAVRGWTIGNYTRPMFTCSKEAPKPKTTRQQGRRAQAVASSSEPTCGFGYWRPGQTCRGRSGKLCTWVGSTASSLRLHCN
jgi:hypothetical protein